MTPKKTTQLRSEELTENRGGACYASGMRSELYVGDSLIRLSIHSSDSNYVMAYVTTVEVEGEKLKRRKGPLITSRCDGGG